MKPPNQLFTEEQPWDKERMQSALELAIQAQSEGEIPVGALVYRDDLLLGEGYNSSIGKHDPTSHAEIVAMRRAAAKIGNYRLTGATLYVTLEPCVMCLGAMIHARIGRIVFAAREPRAGSIVSRLSLLDESFFNHRMQWTQGVLAESSRRLLSEFFKQRRALNKSLKSQPEAEIVDRLRDN